MPGKKPAGPRMQGAGEESQGEGLNDLRSWEEKKKGRTQLLWDGFWGWERMETP